jgi:hypothetical protein
MKKQLKITILVALVMLCAHFVQAQKFKFKHQYLSAGVQKTMNTNQVGLWASYGDKFQLITEYAESPVKRESVFIRVPLKLTDVRTQAAKTFYVGAGKRVSKYVSFHLLIGLAQTDIVRVNNVNISDPRFITYKIGVVQEFSKAVVKFDYDPVLKNPTWGIGFKF